MQFIPLDKRTDAQYLAFGAAADIWKVPDGLPSADRVEKACVHKVLRVGSLSSGASVFGAKSHDNLWQDFLTDYRNKVNIWESLRHDNIVRVLGLGDGLNLRVEFCEGGPVRDYLKANSISYPDKSRIILDVMNGLSYLHTHVPPIVHGNLNAGKVFIDATGATKIGEFGLAALCYPFSAFVPSVSFTELSRWFSPEMIDTDIDTVITPTTESDIWALGCVLFEIIAQAIPYSNRKHDVLVQRSILAGEAPGQCNEHFEDQPYKLIWPLLTQCWATHPKERPSASSLLEQATPILQVSEREIKSPGFRDISAPMATPSTSSVLSGVSPFTSSFISPLTSPSTSPLLLPSSGPLPPSSPLLLPSSHSLPPSSGLRLPSHRFEDQVLWWTSQDPRESCLFTTHWGILYRFTTENTVGRRVTTLHRAIRQGREDRVAKLEWAPNGGLGRAVIGRQILPMADLVRPDGGFGSRTFNGPDGYPYKWCLSEENLDLLLKDSRGNVVAFYRPTPVRRFNVGEVYGEMHFVTSAGAGTVLHPPLMNMICVTALLYRLVSMYNL